MKILALVKHVPDATGEREFAADGTVDREAADGLLSELDEYAVEQALQIVDSGVDAEVVALTVGPNDAADAIKKALQMGAAAGIHVNDEAIHGSDALATSTILAAAIKKSGADLVVCGMSSTDGAMGVVPAMVAERLGWPAASFAHKLTVSGQTATIERDGDYAAQTVEVVLPAIISVTDQSGEARYPSMKGVIAAKKKPVDEWTLADLELDTTGIGLDGAATKVTETTPRPPKEAGSVVTDEDSLGASALVDYLSSKKFI